MCFKGDVMTNTFDICAYVKSELQKHTDGDVAISVPCGEYHIYTDNTTSVHKYISNHDIYTRNVAFYINSKRNVTVDFCGARLVMHGRVMPFLVENSKNITIKNLNVDYSGDFYIEASIKGQEKDGLLLSIDKNRYDYYIEDKKLYHKGEGFTNLMAHMCLEYDSTTKTVARGVCDWWVAQGFMDFVQIDDSTVKLLNYPYKVSPQSDTLVLRGEKRYSPGIVMCGCSDVDIDSVTFYHAGGMAFFAQLSQDITLKSCKVLSAEHRCISAIADASHFVACKGQIKVENCVFKNQMDDAINVHSAYGQITKRLGEAEIEVSIMHHQQEGVNVFGVGDCVCVIDKKTLAPVKEYKVRSSELTSPKTIKLTLDREFDAHQVGFAIENITRYPDAVYIADNEFCDNRARGILVTVKGKVVIENNKVCAPGANVFVNGDANYWYESGNVDALTIKGNTFIDNTTPRHNWGDACIYIHPELIEHADNWYYHKNITVCDNTFYTPNEYAVNALSVDGLAVENNVAFVDTAENFEWVKSQHCTGQKLGGNKVQNVSEAI